MLTATLVTSTGLTFTVVDAEYVLPSYVTVPVIVAVPSATPVTTPFESTFAIASLLDVHSTALISGSFGSNVAVTFVVEPAKISASSAVTVTAISFSTYVGSIIRCVVTFVKSVSQPENV